MNRNFVLSKSNATFQALELLPSGTRLNVYTRNKPRKARTNLLGVITKTDSVWGDWEISDRLQTSDSSQLVESWPESGLISNESLSRLINADDIWIGAIR